MLPKINKTTKKWQRQLFVNLTLCVHIFHRTWILLRACLHHTRSKGIQPWSCLYGSVSQILFKILFVQNHVRPKLCVSKIMCVQLPHKYWMNLCQKFPFDIYRKGENISSPVLPLCREDIGVQLTSFINKVDSCIFNYIKQNTSRITSDYYMSKIFSTLRNN